MALDGKWNFEVSTPMGAQKGLLELKTDGGSLSGKASGDQGDMDFTGTADGDNGSWDAKVTKPMPMTLTFSVTANGDELSGMVKAGAFGSFPVKGTRA